MNVPLRHMYTTVLNWCHSKYKCNIGRANFVKATAVGRHSATGRRGVEALGPTVPNWPPSSRQAVGYAAGLKPGQVRMHCQLYQKCFSSYTWSEYCKQRQPMRSIL